MMRLWLFFIISLLITNCIQKTPQNTNKNSEGVEIDSATDFYEESEDKTVYAYRSFEGIYDHESTTRGFSAVLMISESGNDLSFTVSVSQGNCKGEAKGKIVMVSHEENYHAGFFEQDQCPLQFSLMLREAKIDVKEINFCKLHESGCSFEGTFVKRKN